MKLSYNYLKQQTHKRETLQVGLSHSQQIFVYSLTEGLTSMNSAEGQRS